ACACKCREVDHQFWALARSDCERVGQHHAPLRIAVRDLDGHAVRGAYHFLRSKCTRTDFVLCDREPAIDVVRRAQLTEREHRADCDGAALHVRMHVVHALVRFQVDPARVEADALTYESNVPHVLSLSSAKAQSDDASVALL